MLVSILKSIAVFSIVFITLDMPIVLGSSKPMIPKKYESLNYSFSAKAMDGNMISFDKLKGNIVFVNFWASWCPPCVREIPSFNHLQKTYTSDLKIIGISTDENINDVHKFMKDVPLIYPNIADLNGDITQKYGGLVSIPVTFVFDKDLKFITKLDGYRTYKELEDLYLSIKDKKTNQ